MSRPFDLLQRLCNRLTSQGKSNYQTRDNKTMESFPITFISNGGFQRKQQKRQLLANRTNCFSKSFKIMTCSSTSFGIKCPASVIVKKNIFKSITLLYFYIKKYDFSLRVTSLNNNIKNKSILYSMLQYYINS